MLCRRIPRGKNLWSTIPTVATLLLLSAGCDSPANSETDSERIIQEPTPSVADSVGVINGDLPGQMVYVPTYSHIYTQDGTREFDLAATLSIRNTDPEHAIMISRVRYFNSDGQLVRQYVTDARRLGPLSSMAVVIEERDRAGGVGANFIVEWHSEANVSQPIIEAVMISTAGTQGISFVSRGQVVRPLP